MTPVWHEAEDSGGGESAPPVGAASDSAQSLYLSLMNDRLMGAGDPRAMLQQALHTNQFLLLAQKIVAVRSGPEHAV